MAEEKPSLHIDTDWKKQAQEEKKRLAEEEQKKRQAESTSPPRPAPGISSPTPGAGAAPGGRASSRGTREMPEASFGTLVQSILTQILFYLGDISTRGGEPMVNLDMAKHHIDTLNILEEKTKGNLTQDEQRLLDAALYESRMRYVSVASQYIA